MANGIACGHRVIQGPCLLCSYDQLPDPSIVIWAMCGMLTPKGIYILQICIYDDDCLCNTVNSDGTITVKVHNPAVSVDLLKEILCWKAERCTDKDVIARLRQRTVPSGYQYTTWYPG